MLPQRMDEAADARHRVSRGTTVAALTWAAEVARLWLPEHCFLVEPS